MDASRKVRDRFVVSDLMPNDLPSQRSDVSDRTPLRLPV